MKPISPSNDFPNDAAFVKNVTNAVMAIICENIPALKGDDLAEDIAKGYNDRMEDNFGDRSMASNWAANRMAQLQTEDLQNVNLGTSGMDSFQSRLEKEIAAHIALGAEDVDCLSLYIRDERETLPTWLNDMIKGVAQDTGFDLYRLMPNRSKIAITIHKDGEIFWGTSSYGAAQATNHLKDYLGKPEGNVPFVAMDQLRPDTSKAYALNLGAYVPVIVPADEEKHHAPVTPKIEALKAKLSLFADGRTPTQEQVREDPDLEEPERLQKHLDFLEGVQKLWNETKFHDSDIEPIAPKKASLSEKFKNILKKTKSEEPKVETGTEPSATIAFVPKAIMESLSETDFSNLAALRELRDHATTIRCDTIDQYGDTRFSPELPGTPKSLIGFDWDGAFIDPLGSNSNVTKIDIIKQNFDKSMQGNYGRLGIMLCKNGDHFHLVSAPFYLAEVPDNIQTGVGRNNRHLRHGEILAFVPNPQDQIGQYSASKGDIFKFPHTVFSYVRQIEPTVRSTPQQDNCDKATDVRSRRKEREQQNARRFGNSLVDVDTDPEARPQLRFGKG